MTEWFEFELAVKAAGLFPELRMRATDGGPSHWQIKGGYKMVNCWPNTKRGFRYQAIGENVKTGAIADAIDAAGGGLPKQKITGWGYSNGTPRVLIILKAPDREAAREKFEAYGYFVLDPEQIKPVIIIPGHGAFPDVPECDWENAESCEHKKDG